jgi:hypothetical protein
MASSPKQSAQSQFANSGKHSLKNDKTETKEKLTENSLPYGLDESQLNDLFNMLNSNTNTKQQYASGKNEEIGNPIAKTNKFSVNSNNNKKLIPKPEILEHHDIDIEKYFNEASSATSVSSSLPSTFSSIHHSHYTTQKPISLFQTSSKHPIAVTDTQPNKQASFNSFLIQDKKEEKSGSLNSNNPRISYTGNVVNTYNKKDALGSLGVEMFRASSKNECIDNRDGRYSDELYCNLYHLCNNGAYQVFLCPEGYLFSSLTQKCEQKSKVECGKRMALDFDRSNVPYMDYMNDYYNSAASPKIINGSLECSLGTDGYFADPEFCNIYHHCLAGVDYAEQCPHQLVWNDRKKMCDWQTSVNCTGRIIPVALGIFFFIHLNNF